MSISRLRLLDFQNSRGPVLVGTCPENTAGCSIAVNEAQERLVTCREAGETGWYGGYAEMVFNVDPDDPYITLPRGVARLIKVAPCTMPIPIQNQFYEYLEFGSGRWPKLSCDGTTEISKPWFTQAMRRNTVPTSRDLTVPGYTLRIFTGHADDVGKNVVVSCLDSNGLPVVTEHNSILTQGVYVTLAATSADLVLPDTVTALEISAITGIQKDETKGAVFIYEVNTTTSAMTLLLRMEPGETVAHYTRYYLSGLPNGCCYSPGLSTTVQVHAMVKLDLVPALVSTDYLLIQSLEAIIEECQSVRQTGMDSPRGVGLGDAHHRSAIRFLQGQLVHYEGKQERSTAIEFFPFGSAHLSHQKIGSLI